MSQSALPARVIDPSDILTTEGLAKRLQVPKSWVYEKLREGNTNPLPVFSLGRYLRFSWADVSAWLDSTKEQYLARPRRKLPSRAKSVESQKPAVAARHAERKAAAR